MNKQDFWQNKRVIVTGGAGFLGTHVVQLLKEQGANDIIVPRSASYDLRSLVAIKELLHDTRDGDKPVDMVIHLAARVGGIGANRAHPADFFYDNLMMGVQLLHESWQSGVDKFIAIGTVCAYPKFTPVPFKEESLWDGYPEETNAPYGLAKKMLLVQSQTYREQYGYNSIFLLPVNLYGPGDNFDLQTSHVIPALIRKCLVAKAQNAPSIEAWGDGSPTREFLFVRDAAKGILLASAGYDESNPVNLGSDREISIRDLLVLIAGLVGYGGEIVWDLDKPNGQPRRKLDTTKARALFGFAAQTPFEQGLAETVSWYTEALALGG